MEIYVCKAPQIEIRGTGSDPKILSGYAAVFNCATDIGPYSEQIDSRAFDQALADPDLDVIALFDHSGQPLGRTSNGTLKLSTDSHGLRYQVTPPDTSLGRDILALVARGDVSSSSFAFSIRGMDGDTWDYSGAVPMRTLRNINLHDVSPVTSPAYASTTVSARSKQNIVPTQKGNQSDIVVYEREIADMRARNADIRLFRFKF